MQINAASVAALNKGFRVIFDTALQGAEPGWRDIAMETSSSSASESYNWLGAVPSMKKLVGEVVIENLTASEWEIKNDEFESTIGVKQADIEQDRSGIYNPMFASLGASAGQHPDELVADLLNNGFTKKDYTGKNFFDADKKHAPNNAKSAKFSNKGVGVLNAENYSIAKQNLKGRKNGAGRAMKLGKKLLLIVPPALEDTALEILTAEKNAAGATNIQRNSAQIVVLPDLTSDTAWFLIEAGLAVKPLLMQFEKKPTLSSLTNMESDHVFKNHEFLYQAYGRYNAGYGLPQLAYGSTGEGA